MGARSSKVDIPGVVYSEDYKPETLADYKEYTGGMQHLVEESVPDLLRGALERKSSMAAPAPEMVPYTLGERLGFIAIRPERLRPRQYYIPTTDFRYYDYDEMSPEERELKERFMARMFDMNWGLPSVFFGVTAAFSAMLPMTIRLPILMFGGVFGTFLEAYRTYHNAAVERENLDDFIVAKEIWYIKNVETPQFEYSTYVPGEEPKVPRTRISYAAGDE
jgi:hypothetical protein